METNIEDALDIDSYSLAKSYLTGVAYGFWIVYKESDDCQQIQTSKNLKNFILCHLDTLNKKTLCKKTLYAEVNSEMAQILLMSCKDSCWICRISVKKNRMIVTRRSQKIILEDTFSQGPIRAFNRHERCTKS